MTRTDPRTAFNRAECWYRSVLDEAGGFVVGMRVSVHDAPSVQVETRHALDAVVARFGLDVGEPYGDVRHPVVAATGTVDGVPVEVFGPYVDPPVE